MQQATTAAPAAIPHDSTKAPAKARYAIGAELASPFTVMLTIDPLRVDADQFRADLPRIAARLEQFIDNARREAALRQGGAV